MDRHVFNNVPDKLHKLHHRFRTKNGLIAQYNLYVYKNTWTYVNIQKMLHCVQDGTHVPEYQLETTV